MLFAPLDNDHAPPTLGTREVHLWSVDIDAASLPHLLALLSDDERDRVARYFREMDRARFVVVRAALRTLLGRYLQTPPEAIGFYDGPHGKPHLRATGDRRLHFNVSHSGGLALLAFCETQEVGVDVERVRDMADAERMARRFFTPGEAEQWAGFPPDLRLRAFFELWTRKEAYAKALGRGVTSDAVRLPDPQDEEWSIFDVSPSAAYAAALAIPGRGWDLQSWTMGPGQTF